MKICIVGAGAVGTTIAVRLSMRGHDVSVVARGATLAAICRQGLRLHDVEGTHIAAPRATQHPAALAVQDIVFVCTKTTSLSEVLPTLAPLIGTETIIVPTINGVPWWYFQGTDAAGTHSLSSLDPDGVLASAIPFPHLLGCVVYITAETLAPGVVRATNRHRLILGELDGADSARLTCLGKLLGEAGIATETSSRIRDHVWTKVLANLGANPLSVLTGATLAQIYGEAPLRPVVRRILDETMATATAYGAHLPFEVDAFMDKCAKLGAIRTSMLQDHESGRPLELPAIGDAVLELAARKGIVMTATADIIALARACNKNRTN